MEKEQNIVKTEIQDLAVAKAQEGNLLLSWATGCGKSLAALKIAQTIKSTWYIVCKETNHIDNWKQELKKHKIKLDNIEIFCYDSLHKYSNTKANLILDEIHCITPLRINLLTQISFDKVICLSATVPDEKKELLSQFITFKEYHISLSEAIEKGIVPAPKVYIVDIYLDNSRPTEIHVLKKGNAKERQIIKCNFQERFKVFKEYKDVELHISCTQKQKIELLNSEIEYYKLQHFKLKKQWTEFKWLQAGLSRKKYISSIKAEKAKLLLARLEDKRLVCFTGSIEQCNTLGGDLVVHSKTDVVNLDLIEKFNSLKINKLFAVKMLREGMNLEKIDASIIIQLDNQLLSFIQMLGRCIRGALPECYIFVVRGTQDEVYLNNALFGFNTKYLYKFDNLL